MAGSDSEEKFESSPENSSLSSESASPPPTPLPAPSQNMEVEHYSERPLPFFWRQYSDLRTGEAYYINWCKGIRTSVDPRISVEAAEAAGYFLSDEDEDDDDDDDEDDEDDDGDNISEDDGEDHEYSGNNDANTVEYSIPDSYESSDASSESSWI